MTEHNTAISYDSKVLVDGEARNSARILGIIYIELWVAWESYLHLTYMGEKLIESFNAAAIGRVMSQYICPLLS